MKIEELRKLADSFFEWPTARERKCWCHTCRPVTLDDMRMVLCPDCGNKRCPKANDHRNSCTESNEPGQIGSAYPAPQAQPAPTNKEQSNAKDSD